MSWNMSDLKVRSFYFNIKDHSMCWSGWFSWLKDLEATDPENFRWLTLRNNFRLLFQLEGFNKLGFCFLFPKIHPLERESVWSKLFYYFVVSRSNEYSAQLRGFKWGCWVLNDTSITCVTFQILFYLFLSHSDWSIDGKIYVHSKCFLPNAVHHCSYLNLLMTIFNKR